VEGAPVGATRVVDPVSGNHCCEIGPEERHMEQGPRRQAPVRHAIVHDEVGQAKQGHAQPAPEGDLAQASGGGAASMEH
jgi:hypothetical protein